MGSNSSSTRLTFLSLRTTAQQQVEECLEPTACWKWEQVQPEPERDLRWWPGGEGRLHGRRRKSPLCQGLSGRWTVVGLVTWGVGCASDVPESTPGCHISLDRPELNLFICMNNLIKRWEFL